MTLVFLLNLPELDLVGVSRPEQAQALRHFSQERSATIFNAWGALFSPGEMKVLSMTARSLYARAGL